MGFRYSLIRVGNLDNFYGFVIACFYQAVLHFVFENAVVVNVVVVESL